MNTPQPRAYDDEAENGSKGRYSAEARRARIVAASGPRQGLRKLADSVQVYWRESGLNRRPKESQIYDAVHTTLGVQYGRHARAVKFTRGIVTVEVSSRAHHMELSSFAGAGVVEAANRILGAERITKIVYKSKG